MENLIQLFQQVSIKTGEVGLDLYATRIQEFQNLTNLNLFMSFVGLFFILFGVGYFLYCRKKPTPNKHFLWKTNYFIFIGIILFCSYFFDYYSSNPNYFSATEIKETSSTLEKLNSLPSETIAYTWQSEKENYLKIEKIHFFLFLTLITIWVSLLISIPFVFIEIDPEGSLFFYFFSIFLIFLIKFPLEYLISFLNPNYTIMVNLFKLVN